MKMNMPPTKTQYFPLVGGLDVESAQMSRKPGLVMAASNYESSPQTGYERVGGFERFSGQPRPSDATYKVFESASSFAGTLAVGDTVNGQTSGATAKVIQLLSSTRIVVTKITGTFTLGENIREVTTVVGVYTRDADDITGTDENTLTALAAANYRADIAAVPGSGNMRGIAVLGTTMYAFRDNVGATALAIYKSSSSGWVNVLLPTELSFTGGSGTAPAEGATLTKGGTTGTLRRLILVSGTWAGSNAAGRMILDTVASGPFTVGAFTAGVTATVSVQSAQLTMLPGGRLDHVTYNFTGSTDTERIYGCDGVNFGWEFDGATLVPIRTGMTVDVPRHVAAHRNHLFFAFKGSVQNSGIGTPYTWTTVLGAAEIAVGQEVTGFSSLPGATDSAPLMIFSNTRTMVIYGSSSADWKPTTFSSYIGAQRWSVQNIGNPVVFNSLGVVPVVQSQEFGNFSTAPASDRIRGYLANKVVLASVVNRRSTRMRLFFSDGDAISITPVDNVLRFMQINYGKTVYCAIDANMTGIDRNFFASSDGFVYEADVGRSFDGVAIDAWAKLAFNHAGSPSLKKRFRKVDVEVNPESALTVFVQGEYSLGTLEISPTTLYTGTIAGSGGRYDVSSWDSAFYDASEQTVAPIRIDGVGTNLSLTFASYSAVELPHLLQSVTTSYTPRRLER